MGDDEMMNIYFLMYTM